MAEYNDPYPPTPAFTNRVMDNFYYPDGSLFQYDLSPRNVLNEWDDIEEGGIYDLPRHVYHPWAGGFIGEGTSGWSHWVDKMQKDYRFAAMSDMNARGQIFNEVQDPWMFTEYVYQGSSTKDAQENSDARGVGIVEPPLLNPLKVTRLYPENDNTVIQKTTLSYLNNQLPTTVPVEHGVMYDMEDRWQSEVAPFKEYWTSELQASGWVEDAPTGINRAFKKLNIQRRVIRMAAQKINSGVKMYRHTVWAKSTRWGQSQNIPDRTITMTAPKEYFVPDGVFTGRIVPKISITWGIPFYDNCTVTAAQKVIKYDYFGAGYGLANSRIGLKAVTLSGTNGKPDSIFKYPKSPENIATMDQILMPKNSLVQTKANTPDYEVDDLVHRGCQFWVGKVNGDHGEAKCTYYTKYPQLFGVLWEDSPHIYTDQAFALTNPFPVQGFYAKDDEIQITIESGDSGEVNILDCGKKITLIQEGGSATNFVLIEQASGTLPVYPLKTKLEGGFLNVVGPDATIRIRRFTKNRPQPHKELCGMYESLEDNKAATDKADAINGYKREAKARNFPACAYYTPMGQRVVGSYTTIASNGAEWANMQRGLPPGYKKGPLETAAGQTMMDVGFASGGLLGLFTAASVQTPDPYTSTITKEDFQRIEVTYEPEIISLTGKSTYYDTYDQKPHGKTPEADLRVKQPSGFHSIDVRADAPLSGVDSTFFGMVNQINYRIMRNVMHCFKASKCNPIINQPGGNVGWRRGWFGGIDFTAHPLHVPGYPAGNGKDESGKTRHCFTGNQRCPFNMLDRRAFEYKENYKVLINEIMKPFRSAGINAFSSIGIVERFINADGKIVDMDRASFDQTDRNYMCVGVREVASGIPVLGHWQPVAKDALDETKTYRIYFYYDRPSWDPGHIVSQVFAHIVQFNDDDQACYMDVSALSTADKTKLRTLTGDETKIPWLVELQDDYEEPVGNLIQATNGKPFAGGRHPEYQDLTKRDRMILGKRGGYYDTFGREGAADGNKFGGRPSKNPPLVSQTTVGYWIDEMGDWILDGREIGWNEGYVPARPRMFNKPGYQGKRVPVQGKPGIKIEDPDFPKFNRTGDWATVGHTYSNDTEAYIRHLQEIWQDELPADPMGGDGAKVQIVPPDPNPEFLPRERIYFKCSHCGINFPEEEVNFLKTRRYSDNTLMYPVPANYVAPSGTTDPANANNWSHSAAMGCPRGCGGALHEQGQYIRFMSTYGQGEVDVWGPPGTTVKHDGFFWKNPTMVNRVHHDQIIRKLGTYNQVGGGGYDFGGLVPGVNAMGRLPATNARGYQAGLSRQIVAPWAKPEQTITQVRNGMKSSFLLEDTDVAIIQRPGQTYPAQIKYADEGGFTLTSDDLLTFWRSDGINEPFIVGIPISVAADPSQSVLGEPLVMDDPNREPKPKREDYEAGFGGDKMFNDALRRWLIGVVYGTLQNWSSSIYMQGNALAKSLAARGINPALAYPINPKNGQVIDLDERIIAPYAKNEGTGLQMITMKHLQRLRNRVLPMLAYDLNSDGYKAGGDYTDRAQAHHTSRFGETKAPMPMPTWGTIPPQVIAATQTGKDQFVEWEIGDLEGTKARAYYPTGTTWWRMNQLVGQIKRQGGTNPLHLDDSHNSFNEDYTGDQITSTCTYFLHGRIPMDKEVVRALLVYGPSEPPSFEAIGCQGQYTGMVGIQRLDGGIAEDTLTYKGHEFCFWQHYHGFTTNHEKNTGGYGHGDSYSDINSKRHGDGHDPVFVMPDDPSIPGLFSDNIVPLSFAGINPDYLPWLDGGPDKFLKPHMLGDSSFVDETLGFQVNQDFIKPWVWGQPIKFNKDEFETWKDFTYDKYNMLADRYRVRFKASAAGGAAAQTGTYFGGTFRGQHWPRENQPIPGWINYTGYDSSGRFDRRLVIQDKQVETVQTLADEAPGVTDTGGGNGGDQAGNVGKVLNITDVVKKLYNDRVDRYYKCVLGHRFNELFDLVKGKTDTNLGQAERLHPSDNVPMYFWNYRYMKLNYGMWLTDPWHHSPLSNDHVVGGNENGDPITQGAEDRFGRVQEVSGWDYEDVDETSPNYRKYHPISLCYATPSPFEETALPSQKPIPTDDPSDSYWRVLEDRPNVQSFIMDLRSTPYEIERRNWREKPPEIDATNATCPNPSCFVHEHGWTVGEFYENATGTWGIGVTPSIHSEYCANCRSKLLGVQYKDGDGILTVFYDPVFKEDILISGIEAKVTHNSWNPNVNHGFAVEYYNTTIGQWKTLFSVEYDNQDKVFIWQEWGANGWFQKSGPALPAIFRGVEGQSSKPKDATTGIGAHFVVVAAAKVRFRVLRPAVSSRTDPALNAWGTLSAANIDPTNHRIRFNKTALADDPDRYVARTLHVKDQAGNTVDLVCTQAQSVTGNANVVDLFFNGDFTTSHTQFQFAWTEYVSKCTKFRVYGYPFSEGEVTITPPGYTQPIMIRDGIDESRLNLWPSQINDAIMSVGAGSPVVTEEVESLDQNVLYYDVEEDTYDGIKYYKITKGRWYYDWQRNSIRTPQVYRDPKDNTFKNIWLLNQAQYLDEKKPLLIKTLPHSLAIEYITGTGVPVDVAVDAGGDGPSYQLDRECVTVIQGENEEGTHETFKSDKLPAIGKSVPLKRLNGGRFDMKWQVYNHEPLIWAPKMRWVVGDELGAGQWGDSQVMDLFSGNHGANLSELGPNGVIGGKVSGKVTMYGTPNTILSGDLYVYAKAVTTRTYNLPDGTRVVTKERTGGYRKGAFVFRLEVNDTVSGKRTGITTGVPRVLIYMKERNLTDPV